MSHPSLEDYRVDLECYAGPLDLLLFLVKRHEIDLNDIPIARLTEQYLEHLKLIEQIDVNLAGEFLVMAATLLEIKSQMLLPKVEETSTEGEVAPTDANPLDPRYELVQQLLAYKKYKDAANDLDARREEWESRFARVPGNRSAGVAKTASGAGTIPVNADGEENFEVEESAVEIDLEDVHVLDLCAAFARILDTIGQNKSHQVTYDDTPIALHAEDIVDRLQRDGIAGGMTLQQIFVGRHNRSELIGLFLATLELVRQRRIRVIQDKAAGEIKLELRPVEDQELPQEDKAVDWRDPKTGEMQYHWPSEDARIRAERRAKLRSAAIKRRFAGPGAASQPVEEDEIIDVDGDPVADASHEAADESDEDLDDDGDAADDDDEDEAV